MDFRTNIPVSTAAFRLSHADRHMVIGSCFAENIGNRFKEGGFNVTVNPFGVLYNPASISAAIRRLMSEDAFRRDELNYYDGLFHSFSHHSSFSDANADVALSRINSSFRKAVAALKHSTCLMLTFGTAWVYTLPETGQVVANCHKFPANRFQRSRLSVESIVADYSELINALLEKQPDLKLILTVSPIRHAKDGMHENTLSKSVLHLAIANLCDRFRQIVYYPSYELMMDDLRDYRFYGEDMLHPSSVAQEYIWNHFSDTFLSKASRDIAHQVQQIRKAMEHKPFHPEDEAYKRFAQKNIASIELLCLSVPGLDLKEERQFFEKIIN
ncbi:MAG: GSCFA domain-containing protein [Bacteroidota bacterium]|nr:GSCFA domain-containing protein [Bacteroidota bacterium]